MLDSTTLEIARIDRSLRLLLAACRPGRVGGASRALRAEADRLLDLRLELMTHRDRGFRVTDRRRPR